MPEKIYTKFGEPPQLPATKKADRALEHTTKPNQSNGHKRSQQDGGGLKNGVKRMRDGSPKPEFNSNKKQKFRKIGVDNGPKHGDKQGINGHNQASTKQAGRPDNKFQGANRGALQNFPKKQSWVGNNGQRGNQNGGKGKRQSYEAPLTQRLRMEAAQLEKTRKELPIWTQKDYIRHCLRKENVLLLNGETGSGKSTQVPQFLCNEPWCTRKLVQAPNAAGRMEDCKVGGIIAITQPRRVAAMSLAQRVAKEMGSSLANGVAGDVGYAVRFNHVTPPGMKIKFVTEGILLQEMLHDPNLRYYSAIIVDEIHERSVDVDLISGFLRTLVHSDFKGRGGIPLKVVVMSATFDLGGIEAFFAKPGSLPDYVPGKTHGNIFRQHLLQEQNDQEAAEFEAATPDSLESRPTFSSWSGFNDSDNEGYKDKTFKETKANTKTNGSLKGKKVLPEWAKDIEILNRKPIGIPTYPTDHDPPPPDTGVAFVFVEGRQYGVDLIYEKTPSQDYLQEMLKIILHLHITEPLPGDILAFLTGQDEIETLQSKLEKQAETLVKTLPRMKVMPLYGSMPGNAQQEVFEKVKEKFTRKIVLATNIAETSVTVSGVRFVVDCGKSKVKQFRPRLGMESLLVKPISQVSAIQRAGRAGREAKGKCYRVYTEEAFYKLEKDELPEILRSDVIEAVLKMKARGVDDVLTFPLMDSPSLPSMEKALLQLHILGALSDNGAITPTGLKMASFPLPASYGRVLIAAASPENDILLEAIDVISCLTTDSEIFMQPKSGDDFEIIESSRAELAKRHGDIITILNTIQQYAAEPTDRIAFCRDRLLSQKALKSALQIRRQLRSLCVSQSLLASAPPADPVPFEQLTPERCEVLLKVFLKAFVTKTAILAPDGTYLTTQGRNVIMIHPSSTLYGKKVEAIMFTEHVFTTTSYAKRVSAIQAQWIEEAL